MVMSGTHTRAALPTTYNGVNYRSLLEARYAAWFDLIGIEAHYEPEAFAGYIPDFMVHPRDSHAVVVEIKGAARDFDIAKVRRSGWGVGGRCATCVGRSRAEAYVSTAVAGACKVEGRDLGPEHSWLTCSECARAYGNVWLFDGRGPRYAKHYWRKHGTVEWCESPHPASMLLRLSHMSGRTAGLLSSEYVYARIGETAFRSLYEATPYRDPSKRISYEEDRKQWLGFAAHVVDAAWREAGNRVRWRGRGAR